MECFWCLKGHKANAESLRLFCSAEINDELSRNMASNLTGCLDCVMAYHYARQYFLKKNESAQKELFTWEVDRLCQHLEKVLHPNTEISDDNLCVWGQEETLSQDDLFSKLSISLQEILNYPYLLWNKDLSNHTTRAILRLEEERTPLVLHGKFPGVYLLLIHPDCQVRRWAKKSVQFLGPVSCDDYDDLGDVIKWIMSVSEFDLFNFCNNLEDTVLPLALHLFVQDSRKEYWAGVCTLLKKFEHRTIRLQLLSPDHHNQFVAILLSAMENKNDLTYGRDSEFWPLLNCLLILLKRLKSCIWQHITIKKHTDLFVLVVHHPAFRSEVKRMPGYKGKDADRSEDCAASYSQVLNESLLDNEDTSSESSLSFQTLMFVWFKRLLESVVLFGDSASNVVKVIFKYFSYLKGELEIQSQGYNVAMIAMIRCLEFLLNNSLQSFLTVVAKRWIPDLLEILSFDLGKPSTGQEQAISFCKMFLQKNQEIGKDVSNLISWLEEKSDGNAINDSEHLGDLEHLLTLYFKDYPPVTRNFSRVQRTIVMPKASRSCSDVSSEKRNSSKSPSNLLPATNTDKKYTVGNKPFRKSHGLTNRSPLLQAKVCLEKMDAEIISSNSSNFTTSDEGDNFCLKPVKSVKKNLLAGKRASRIRNIETKKYAQKKQEPVIIIDDSSDDSDNEPFGLRYPWLKSVDKVQTGDTEYLSGVNDEDKLNSLNTNEDSGKDFAQPGSFNNDDNGIFHDFGDDSQINSVGWMDPSHKMEPNAMTSDRPANDEEDHDIISDDFMDQNMSSSSRKRKIVSKTAPEEICVLSSDDEILIDLVSSLSSRDVPKVDDECPGETQTKKRKKEERELKIVESDFSTVSTDTSWDTDHGDVTLPAHALVHQMDEFSLNIILHGQQDLKDELQTLQMDVVSPTVSLYGEQDVKGELQTLEMDESSQTVTLYGDQDAKAGLETLQMDEVSPTVSLHGEQDVNDELQTLQMDVVSPTVSLYGEQDVNDELQTLEMDVVLPTVSLYGEQDVEGELRTLEMDESSPTVTLYGDQDAKAGLETLQMDEVSPTVCLNGEHGPKDERQTLGMHVVSSIVNADDEHESDGERQGSMQTKKRKEDGEDVFSVGALLSKLETTRNSVKEDVTLPSRKIAQVPQIKPTVTVPLASKNVTRKKPVETKPSKPLTLEELYYVILKWDPSMLEKKFSINIPNSGKVKLTYETMDEYYNVFIPLLFLECWAQALAGKQSSSNSRIEHIFVVKTVQDFAKHVHLITCHKHVSTKKNFDENLLRENDLIIVKMKDDKLRPVFGVVENVQKERSCWKPGDEKNESSSDVRYFDMTISIRLIPKDRALLVHETIRCVVVTSLVTTLRQWQGMMFFPRSLLARDILQPRIEKCCNNKLHQRKTDVEQVYNKSQSAAIDGTLEALRLPYPIPRISFIQGPPGTGKSHTIIGLIKSHLKNREINLQAGKDNRLPGSKKIDEQTSGKILLCAPSNAAVYVLVRRLISEMKASAEANLATVNGKNCGDINLVCVGRTSVIHPEVLPFALETLTKVEVTKRASYNNEKEKNAQGKVQAMREKIEELEKNLYNLRLAGYQDESGEVKCLNTEIDGMVKKKQTREREYHYIRGKKKLLKHEEERIRKEVLFSADVICCTLSASGSVLLHKFLKTSSTHLPFGCIIVDEACQSSELDLLIPLQFGSSKLVLVGDPEQLRSTVLSKKAQELLLGQSMYERLYKVFKKRAHESGRALHMTEDNPIQLLDLQYRMHPQISSFPARYIYQGRVKDESSLATSKSVSSLKPYAMLNVRNGVEQISPSGSLCNPMESDLIVGICSMLQQEISEGHFGIITPYRAQVNLLQKRLRERHLKNVEVDTVDGFQGREKDIVLMSCVRANEGQRRGIGFLADRTRLNVALTRARYSLIILLNVNSLETNNDWRACIDDARQRGVLYDVSSAKDLSQVFQKNDIVETDSSKLRMSTPSHNLSSKRKSLSPHLSVTNKKTSKEDILPPHASVKYKKASIKDHLSRHVNVPNEKTTEKDINIPYANTSKEDILPPHASVTHTKAHTRDHLSRHVNVPNENTTGKDMNLPCANTYKEDILPPHASVTHTKAHTRDHLSRHGNVPNENTAGKDMNVPAPNTSKEDILPPHVSVTYKKAPTKDNLARYVNVPNANTRGDNINDKEDILSPGFEEFDFDDHEPDNCSSHGNDEIGLGGQLERSFDCRVNKSLMFGELVDLVVHSGERIQAQQNPYMQQLVKHEREVKEKTLSDIKRNVTAAAWNHAC